MSKVIKASQIRQEEKLRQLFAEKVEATSTSDQEVLEDSFNPEEEAQNIIESARREAEALIEQTELEVNQYKEAGYHEGFQQGFEEGYEQVMTELQNLLHNFKREIDRAQMMLDTQVKGLTPKIVRLSSDIAAKIVHRQVQLEPEIIVDQIENILRGISRVKSLAIRVNPGDLQRARANEERFLQLIQGIDQIDFVIDHSLDPGGCIIETNSGGVDASIQTQLEMITSILLEGNGDENV